MHSTDFRREGPPKVNEQGMRSFRECHLDIMLQGLGMRCFKIFGLRILASRVGGCRRPLSRHFARIPNECPTVPLIIMQPSRGLALLSQSGSRQEYRKARFVAPCFFQAASHSILTSPKTHTLTLHPLLTTMTIAQTYQNLNPSWPQARRASIYHFGTKVFKPAADVSYMSHVVLSASLK